MTHEPHCPVPRAEERGESAACLCLDDEFRYVEDCANAIESAVMPCNPIPFANSLANGVRAKGTDWIKSRQAQRILWVLLSQSYGQLSTIDLLDEYERLTRRER